MLSTSVETTEALGRQLASLLLPGDILLLEGDLGAGKTSLSRGIAEGLGIQGPIQSPTYTLLRSYTEGTIPLHHFDLYRLDDADAFFEAGLQDYIGGHGIALIEWPTVAIDALPACHLHISLSYGELPDTRIITITPCGGFREVNLCATC